MVVDSIQAMEVVVAAAAVSSSFTQVTFMKLFIVDLDCYNWYVY